jgi:2-oxoisovalerate dehydrogenase E1 component
VANFPHFYFAEVDGTDPEASLRAFEGAVAHCRAGLGPAFVHGHVVRPYSHALSDDDKHYRMAAEREADALREPLAKMQMRLLREGILTADEITALEQSLDHEVAEAGERALAAPLPKVESIREHVYSEDLDPTSTAFATEQAHAPGDAGGGKAGGAKGSGPRTMADLINACLHDEMRRDPRIVVYGEDVADASREEALNEVEGKGGVFKLTAGLQTEFGSDRVFNSPLAEANIVGRAVGYAARGMKPVVEIQFFDYIWPAMHQIRNELALMRWRSNGTWAASRAAPSTTPAPAKASLRTFPACAWSFLPTLWTPTDCCAPPSAATIRCCFWSTSGSTARPMGARPIRGRSSPFRLARPKS